MFTVVFRRTGEKTTQKTTQKILELISQNPKISRKEMAINIAGITEDGVKYNLNKLKNNGIIERIGPAKGGYWKILKKL
jgi:ATP-dependent DNA helicase RecG